MKNNLATARLVSAAAAMALMATVAAPAGALDGYQDRRGLFTGIGLGGGAAFQDGDPGGALLLDLQLGGGATERLTLDLDVDFWFQSMENHDNWLITPGPEVNFFLYDGLFIRGAIGMALTFMNPDAGDADFEIGFDGAVGAGWEFFAGSNLALGLCVEGDYVLLKGDDIISVGFLLSARYY